MITALTLITNPVYRQDPWRESIAQMLLVFDHVVVVCGAEEDEEMVRAQFGTERCTTVFEPWPQPEWSFEELPKHLNIGLAKAREIGSDWVVRLDIDTCVHEKDKDELHSALDSFSRHGIPAARMEKTQFISPLRGYQKGKNPFALNMHTGNIMYGYDVAKYTDLCQPIRPLSGVTTVLRDEQEISYCIPSGEAIAGAMDIGVQVWNYDYTFKTKARATELLYHFDRSHAKFFGSGFGGKKIDEITPETALNEFMELERGRLKKCIKKFSISDHPEHMQSRLRQLSAEEFGCCFWADERMMKTLQLLSQHTT